MQVLIRESPRAIVLISSDPSQDGAHSQNHETKRLEGHPRSLSPAESLPMALVISSMASQQDIRTHSAALASVELIDIEKLDNSNLRRVNGTEVLGCLGLIHVGPDLFAAVVTTAAAVGEIRPGELVMKVTSVSFLCVTRGIWDEYVVGGDSFQETIDNSDSPTTGGDLPQSGFYEHPCTSLRKLLINGSFYFAFGGTFDLFTRLDQRIRDPATRKSSAVATSRFVWNSFLIDPLLTYRQRLRTAQKVKFDRAAFLLLVIQGFVGVAVIDSATTLSVVSRLSWKRAGTRFNTRGVDDDGNVANFVESETILRLKGEDFSYVQVRGSVPLFWEQAGLQTFNARIQVTRPRIASQPAFDRHFMDLIREYGHVHAVNLLGTRDAETLLTGSYAEHMRHSKAEDLWRSKDKGRRPSESTSRGNDGDDDDDRERVGLTNFDFHNTSRLSGGIDGVRQELRYLGPVQLKRAVFGWNFAERTLKRGQSGVFRLNCLDCLDRTNVVAEILSQFALEEFLGFITISCPELSSHTLPSHTIWVHHRFLWAENGDSLSRIYAGTGALNTSFTRTGKKTLGGLLSDAAKSAGRIYINNFQDKGKQTVIDMLLGHMTSQQPVSVYDPLHDPVDLELTRRLPEYSSTRNIVVFAGTWNLNGNLPSEPLLQWLFPDQNVEPDILVIAFQEMVELTPQQILLTDPEKRRIWEAAIAENLAARPNKRSDYIIVRSEQLVGTALILVIKEQELPFLRHVEASSRKTGLKGMSGNKGGVGIRFRFLDSTFCFITAHLAAGQSSFDERNDDYSTIARGLVFQKGRPIVAHDFVVWLGDFNYRLNLTHDIVHSRLQEGNVEALLERDQLTVARESGLAFAGFQEGPISFLPTYKYDNNSDVYDTSEKQRIPAWTDRILFSGDQLRLIRYDRAELRMSDHRPVFAMFTAPVRMIDVTRQSELRAVLLDAQRHAQGRHTIAGIDRDSTDSSDVDDDVAEPSSGESSWWARDTQSTTPNDRPEDWLRGNPFRISNYRSGGRAAHCIPLTSTMVDSSGYQAPPSPAAAVHLEFQPKPAG